jgi:hypothetical protein
MPLSVKHQDYRKQERTDSTMGRRKVEAAIDEREWETDYVDLTSEPQERPPLVLQKEPPPRKVALMAAGVRQIRCVHCSRIVPIAESSELGSGWICAECASEGIPSRD